MNMIKVRNWDIWIGVWIGIVIISLINLALIFANHNQFLYDWYILGVSIIVLIVFSLLRSRSKL
jgi:ribose/xylose/arabinose/galactoside ABC-type transport system permease subunit